MGTQAKALEGEGDPYGGVWLGDKHTVKPSYHWFTSLPLPISENLFWKFKMPFCFSFSAPSPMPGNCFRPFQYLGKHIQSELTLAPSEHLVQGPQADAHCRREPPLPRSTSLDH